ncbi:hypothetical protein GQ602_000226 [Ophiocordyceps camponoti-floridani]|uniref:Uncharacterized protein n=1 Tax=Ophiocordyceps camponoti-floridani TaxID=2030778 RepID=A0A8H4VG34_9HYPO|nr:hypothetical protein GQ602_000226 [Ophiocordyceps camponoti-floridani]
MQFKLLTTSLLLTTIHAAPHPQQELVPRNKDESHALDSLLGPIQVLNVLGQRAIYGRPSAYRAPAPPAAKDDGDCEETVVARGGGMTKTAGADRCGRDDDGDGDGDGDGDDDDGDDDDEL